MQQETRQPPADAASWAFLTNHAHVLLAISRDQDVRQTEIANVIGITVGAVQRIVNELESAGYLSAERRGRRNHYTINGKQRLQHPLEKARTVQELIDSIENP